MRGKALKFDRSSGYGFLLPVDDETLPDIFVHARDIVRTEFWRRQFLLPGTIVEFDLVTESEDRYRATNVRVIAPVNIARQSSAPGVRR
jgi:cold shock CspA family protein